MPRPTTPALVMCSIGFGATICGAGTLPAPTMLPEIDVSDEQAPNSLRVAGDSILFSGPAPTERHQIWRLRDGVASPLAFACEDGPSGPYAFTQLPGPTVALIVTDCIPIHMPYLARLDPASGAVSPIVSTTVPMPSYAFGISRLGARALLSYQDGSLWATDGTDEGTAPVYSFSAFDRGPTPDPFATVTSLGEWGLLKAAADGTYRPWRTDGTADGTSVLSEIVWPEEPIGGGDSPIFYPLGSRAVFFGQTLVDGYEVWTTDGTRSGTTQVSTLRPGTTYPSPTFLVVCGSVAYFGAFGVVPGGTTPFNLWRTDGTTEGTYPVGTMSGQWNGLSARPVGCLGSKVILFRTLPGTAYLSISDGTPEGTTELLEVTQSFGFQRPGVEYHGWLFFAAELGEDGTELWATNGTPAGTFKASEIAPGLAASMPFELTPLGDSLYFIANDQSHGWEIWRLVVDPSLVFRDGFESATLTAWSEPPN